MKNEPFVKTWTLEPGQARFDHPRLPSKAIVGTRVMVLLVYEARTAELDGYGRDYLRALGLRFFEAPAAFASN